MKKQRHCIQHEKHASWHEFLSSHFAEMQKTGTYCDLTISAKDGSVLAHSLVLSAVSPLASSAKQDGNHNRIIQLPPVSSSVLSYLIEYAYHGKCSVHISELAELLVVAEQLQIDNLVKYCQNHKPSSKPLNVTRSKGRVNGNTRESENQHKKLPKKSPRLAIVRKINKSVDDSATQVDIRRSRRSRSQGASHASPSENDAIGDIVNADSVQNSPEIDIPDINTEKTVENNEIVSCSEEDSNCQTRRTSRRPRVPKTYNEHDVAVTTKSDTITVERSEADKTKRRTRSHKFDDISLPVPALNDKTDSKEPDSKPPHEALPGDLDSTQIIQKSIEPKETDDPSNESEQKEVEASRNEEQDSLQGGANSQTCEQNIDTPTTDERDNEDLQSPDSSIRKSARHRKTSLRLIEAISDSRPPSRINKTRQDDHITSRALRAKRKLEGNFTNNSNEEDTVPEVKKAKHNMQKPELTANPIDTILSVSDTPMEADLPSQPDNSIPIVDADKTESHTTIDESSSTLSAISYSENDEQGAKPPLFKPDLSEMDQICDKSSRQAETSIQAKSISIEEDAEMKELHPPNIMNSPSSSPEKASCPYCHKKCKSSSSVQRHIFAVHPGIRPHQCSKCDLAFSCKKDLKLHLTDHRTADLNGGAEVQNVKFKGYRCYVCALLFPKANDLDAHRKTCKTAYSIEPEEAKIISAVKESSPTTNKLASTLAEARIDPPPVETVRTKEASEKSITETVNEMKASDTVKVKRKKVRKSISSNPAMTTKKPPISVKTESPNNSEFVSKKGATQNLHGHIDDDSYFDNSDISESIIKLVAENYRFNADSYECKSCDSKFRHRHAVERHQYSRHEGPRLYQCKKCDMTFSIRAECARHLQDHKIAEEKGSATVENVIFKGYRCVRCLVVYSTHDELDGHKTNCRKEPKVCIYCGQGFKKCSSLRKHMTDAHKGDQELCTVCNKKVYNLNSHSRVHTDKRYECPTCDKVFNRADNLRVHQRIHSGEKPFVCSICKERFRLKCLLKTHMKHHKRLMATDTTIVYKIQEEIINPSNDSEEPGGSEVRVTKQIVAELLPTGSCSAATNAAKPQRRKRRNQPQVKKQASSPRSTAVEKSTASVQSVEPPAVNYSAPSVPGPTLNAAQNSFMSNHTQQFVASGSTTSMRTNQSCPAQHGAFQPAVHVDSQLGPVHQSYQHNIPQPVMQQSVVQTNKLMPVPMNQPSNTPLPEINQILSPQRTHPHLVQSLNTQAPLAMPSSMMAPNMMNQGHMPPHAMVTDKLPNIAHFGIPQSRETQNLATLSEFAPMSNVDFNQVLPSYNQDCSQLQPMKVQSYGYQPNGEIPVEDHAQMQHYIGQPVAKQVVMDSDVGQVTNNNCQISDVPQSNTYLAL